MTIESESRSTQRRREVANAARRVIIRKGLERTTMRDISREGGFTTGVLTHHFPDKQAVIVGAFRSASDEFETQTAAALDRAESPEDLLRVLVSVSVPDNRVRREEWGLWSEMWTYAGRDPDFAAELLDSSSRWETLIADALTRARDAGLLNRGMDPSIQATVFARLADGLGIRAWLSGDFQGARRHLVGYLGALGLSEDLQQQFVSGRGGNRKR